MDRRVQWALVGLLAVALAYAGIVTRYQYLSPDGAPTLAGRIRIDRWTGAVQVWGCLQYQSEGADKSICVRYGWE